MEKINNKNRYLLVENTVEELVDICNNANTRWNEDFYTYDVAHEGLSVEQLTYQAEKSWDTTVSNTMRWVEDKMYDTIGRFMYEEIANGVKENLQAKVKEDVLKSKIKTVLVIEDRPDGFNNAYIDFIYEDGLEQTDDLIYDEAKMAEDIKRVKRKQYSYNRDDEEMFVYIEKVQASIYAYTWRDAKTLLDKLIKKFVRENLTYCIKQNKIIVPEEYLAKGKAGIEEWRGLKASKNKNNNMEKRMLRSMIREKKISNLEQMRTLVWRFPRGVETNEYDWNVPNLSIYGSGNKAMCHRLMTKILGKKTDQELLNMTKEDVDKVYKEYWKGVLKKAIEQIEGVETYEKK